MRFLILCFLLLSTCVFSQEDIIAKEYFKNGDFEKALLSYKKLHSRSPLNISYTTALVETHQQLKQYQQAQDLLLETLQKINYPGFYVELGYNYQLLEQPENAVKNYNIAFSSIDENPNYVFSVARSFQNHSLLDWAIRSYEKAMSINENLNFNMQLAQIYGEQGNVEKMFVSYIDFLEKNPTYIDEIKRAFSDFLTEDGTSENNSKLRKILLTKIQENPELIWNDLLSWLFIQQKDFNKAFMQEKAIYNRAPESLDRIIQLAEIARTDEDTDIALTIYDYVIKTAQDTETLLQAHYSLLELKTEIENPKAYNGIKSEYLKLFETFGYQTQTLGLQIAYAHFLAFYLNTPTEAENLLKQTLKLNLAQNQIADVKLELADILVLQEKFNEALIYYSQIQQQLKNSTISQEARYRVARTSYFKGDFKWAESQLNILKSSTSQLIANDALDLKLLISDNKYEDSTQTALKLYAKADFLAFQNKNTESITLLNTLLKDHATEPIAANALYKQAKLYESKKEYNLAENNYNKIINGFPDSLLADDAYFALAELYNNVLGQPEKAKQLYEYIIFNFADSIYFVEARKQYRSLRGDTISQ
ncbi:tetratricopeptide repeat protein [Formosa sp. S-31]|uniref:tetratricopeptide repeat protein n=1 Tax=Formosa sp. S-31 TaxID=2790949 RepID=UPI003EB7ED32